MATVIGYDQSLKKKCTCRQCSAIIEYVQNEVQNMRVSCMGDIDIEYYIVCPNCSNKVSVKGY